jgi:hypothetical protein
VISLVTFGDSAEVIDDLGRPFESSVEVSSGLEGTFERYPEAVRGLGLTFGGSSGFGGSSPDEG